MWVSGKSWSGITAWADRRCAAARLLTVFCFAVLLSATPQRAGAQVFSPEQIANINRVEAYLNDLTTLDSRFVQIDPQGGFAEGTVFLSRPGKMRFEYDPPAQLLLVADGNWFIYVDKELEEVSHIPLDSTPASFLLNETISLKEKYKVMDIDAGRGLVTVDVIEREAPENGMVQLVFQDRPLELKQWTVTDAQALDTRVTLINAYFGRELDDELFEFVNPWADATGGKR